MARTSLLFLTPLILISYNVISQPDHIIDSLFCLINDKETPDDSNKVNNLYYLARIVTDYNFQDRLKTKTAIDMRILCDKALEISCHIKYQKGIDEYLHTLDYGCHQDMFIPYIEFQLPIYKEPTDYMEDIYSYRGHKHSHSLYIYFCAQSNVKTFQLTDKSHLVNHRIGLCYYEWKNYKMANSYLKNAMYQARAVSDSNSLSDIMLDLGMSYFKQNEHDSARLMFHEAASIALTLKNDNKLLASYNNIAESYQINRDSEDALNYFRKALSVALALKDTLLMAKAYMKTGFAYTQSDNYDQALLHLTHSLRYNQYIEDKRTERDNYYVLYETYFRSSDNKQALHYFKKYQLLQDSLFATDVSDYINEMENKWQTLVAREISRKEREAIEARQTSLLLNKNRFYLIALLFGILISLIFVYVLYRSYVIKKRSNAYLLALTQERNKLISVISHDLQSPLTGFLNILVYINKNNDKLSKDYILESLTKIQQHAVMVKQMLDNLLEWAKLQRGDIKPHMEVLNLKSILEKNIGIYLPLAAQKEIILHNGVKNDIIIHADSYMLDTVIRNLLDNAIKYTMPGGKITIDENKMNGLVEISFNDDGTGMTRDELDRLFKVATSNTNGYNSGLGMILCKEYIEKCGGIIYADSQGKGHGSKFIIRFPLKD